jgi:hypothetical protein
MRGFPCPCHYCATIGDEMPWPEYTNRIIQERVTLHIHGDFTNHQIMGFKSGKGTGDSELIIRIYPVQHICIDDVMHRASEII